MKIHIDIRHNISPSIALECVRQVIAQGKISADGKSYCYATTFETNEGEVWVAIRPYRKSDCFLVYKNIMEDKTMKKSKKEIRDIAVTAGMAGMAMFFTYAMVAIFG